MPWLHSALRPEAHVLNSFAATTDICVVIPRVLCLSQPLSSPELPCSRSLGRSSIVLRYVICWVLRGCAGGHYKALSGEASCNLCPSGTFAPERNLTRCLTCPRGTGIVDPARTQCQFRRYERMVYENGVGGPLLIFL